MSTAKTQYRVICFGDSNTYGFDPRSFLGCRYGPDDRWVDILKKKSGWEIHNNSMSGREIPRRETNFPKSTDLLLVMLGTNDLLQGNSPEKTATRMENFLNGVSLKKHKILIIAPPPLCRGAWVSDQQLIDESRELAQHYRLLADKLGVHFLDAGEWGVEMAFDGVHLTEAGNRRFADCLWEELSIIF